MGQFVYFCPNFQPLFNMKRQFIILFALMAMALTTSAQGFFTPAANSPEIAKDGSVTFKVKAAGADTVRLIIDTRVDTLMKHTGNETWSITLRNLEPDLYMYHYIIDGMKVLDNENANVLRDVKNVMNTFVLDPKGDSPVAVGQFKRPFTYENPMNPIDQGFMGYSQPVSKLAGFSDRTGMHASNGRDIGLQFQGDFSRHRPQCQQQ